jgi:murein DD-endopeptidase MepM/ murein hydrolase activator NlpD
MNNVTNKFVEDVHNGEDYGIVSGSNLYASGKGKVVVADMCSLENCVYDDHDRSGPEVNHGFGNVIVIEYKYENVPKAVREELELKPGQSVYYLYGHLKDISVKPGDTLMVRSNFDEI